MFANEKHVEVAPQTHLKAISRTSNGSKCIQNTIKTIWGCTSNAPQSNPKNIKWLKMLSNNYQSCLRLHLKRTSNPSQEFQMVQNAFKTTIKAVWGCTSNAPQSNLKNLKWFKMHSTIKENCVRLHLKHTPKPSQEHQGVQKSFKIQSQPFEVAPQTHFKAISRTSSVFTTSSHTSRMAIPSFMWSCHARAASVGCKPRGCTVTCTVGMARGWRCRGGTICGLKKVCLQFGANSDYDLCWSVHNSTTNTRDSKLFDSHWIGQCETKSWNHKSHIVKPTTKSNYSTPPSHRLLSKTWLQCWRVRRLHSRHTWDAFEVVPDV